MGSNGKGILESCSILSYGRRRRVGQISTERPRAISESYISLFLNSSRESVSHGEGNERFGSRRHSRGRFVESEGREETHRTTETRGCLAAISHPTGTRGPLDHKSEISIYNFFSIAERRERDARDRTPTHIRTQRYPLKKFTAHSPDTLRLKRESGDQSTNGNDGFLVAFPVKRGD